MSKSPSRLGRPGSAGSAGSKSPNPRKELQGNRSCMLRVGERLMRAGSEGNLVQRPRPTQERNQKQASSDRLGQGPNSQAQALLLEEKPSKHTGNKSIKDPGNSPARVSSSSSAVDGSFERLLQKQQHSSSSLLSNADCGFYSSPVRSPTTLPRRCTAAAASSRDSELDSLMMQHSDIERKKEVFLDHLRQKYPHHAAVIMGHQERIREQVRSPRPSASPRPGADVLGLAEQQDPLAVETMSEGEVLPPTVPFTRGSRARASLPVVRSTSQTRDRSLGVLYLQYGEETKQVRMPTEITGQEGLRALFVSAFPHQLTMKMLQSPNVAIYIKDTSRNVYYDLEDIRSITSHSCLKVYHKDPAHVFNRHARPVSTDGRAYFDSQEDMERNAKVRGLAGHLRDPEMKVYFMFLSVALKPLAEFNTAFQISKEMLYGSHSPIHTMTSSSRSTLHNLQGSMSPPMVRSMPSSPSRVAYGGGVTRGSTGGVDLVSATLPRERLSGAVRSAVLCPSSSSAILERRDVKPDEDLGSSKTMALVMRGDGGQHYSESYCSLQDGGGGRLSIASSMGSAPPSLIADMVDAGGGAGHAGLQQYRVSIKPLGAYGESLEHQAQSIHRQKHRKYGDSQLPPLSNKTPPPSPHRVNEVRMIDGQIIGGVGLVTPERLSPIRRSLRRDSNGAVVEVVNRTRGSGSSSSSSSVFVDAPHGHPDRVAQGHVMAGDPQSERMKAMEKQIASLTGLVHHALILGPSVAGTGIVSESDGRNLLNNGLGASSGLGTQHPEDYSPTPLALQGSPSDKNLQQSLALAKRNVSELRLQLNQLRQAQLANQESVGSMLRMAGQELLVLMCNRLAQCEEAGYRRRAEMEGERLHYLAMEERVLTQLSELEDYVRHLKKNSASSPGQLSITLRDVEEGTVNLRRVGEALTILKSQFPELQVKMRSVLRVEVEAVRFLKEEPHMMDSMLKRVKTLTEALSTLRRCVSGSTPPVKPASVEPLEVLETDKGLPKTQPPQGSPKPQPRSSVRSPLPSPSSSTTQAEVRPASPASPAKTDQVKSPPAMVVQSPHHNPSPPLTPTHGQDSPSVAKVSPRSREDSPALQKRTVPLQPDESCDATMAAAADQPAPMSAEDTTRTSTKHTETTETPHGSRSLETRTSTDQPNQLTNTGSSQPPISTNADFDHILEQAQASLMSSIPDLEVSDTKEGPTSPPGPPAPRSEQETPLDLTLQAPVEQQAAQSDPQEDQASELPDEVDAPQSEPPVPAPEEASEPSAARVEHPASTPPPLAPPPSHPASAPLPPAHSSPAPPPSHPASAPLPPTPLPPAPPSPASPPSHPASAPLPPAPPSPAPPPSHPASAPLPPAPPSPAPPPSHPASAPLPPAPLPPAPSSPASPPSHRASASLPPAPLPPAPPFPAPPPSPPTSAPPSSERCGRPLVEKPRRPSVEKDRKPSPDKAGKSPAPPPPPPPRRFYAASPGLTTGRSGEVIFTTRKEPVGPQDEDEKEAAAVPQPKPPRQPPEVKPKPQIPPPPLVPVTAATFTSTPVTASADMQEQEEEEEEEDDDEEEEDEEEEDDAKFMKELQVFQKYTVRELGSRCVVDLSASDPQRREIDPKIQLWRDNPLFNSNNGSISPPQSSRVMYYITAELSNQNPLPEGNDQCKGEERTSPTSQVANQNPPELLTSDHLLASQPGTADGCLDKRMIASGQEDGDEAGKDALGPDEKKEEEEEEEVQKVVPSLNPAPAVTKVELPTAVTSEEESVPAIDNVHPDQKKEDEVVKEAPASIPAPVEKKMELLAVETSQKENVLDVNIVSPETKDKEVIQQVPSPIPAPVEQKMELLAVETPQKENGPDVNIVSPETKDKEVIQQVPSPIPAPVEKKMELLAVDTSQKENGPDVNIVSPETKDKEVIQQVPSPIPAPVEKKVKLTTIVTLQKENVPTIGITSPDPKHDESLVKQVPAPNSATAEKKSNLTVVVTLQKENYLPEDCSVVLSPKLQQDQPMSSDQGGMAPSPKPASLSTNLIDNQSSQQQHQDRDKSQFTEEGSSLSPDLFDDEGPPPPPPLTSKSFRVSKTRFKTGSKQEDLAKTSSEIQTISVDSSGNLTDHPQGEQGGGYNDDFDKKPVIIIFNEPMDIQSAYKRLSTIFESEEDLDRVLSPESIVDEDEEEKQEEGENLEMSCNENVEATENTANGENSPHMQQKRPPHNENQCKKDSFGKSETKRKFKFKFPKNKLAAISQAIRTGTTKMGKKTLEVVVYEDEEEISLDNGLPKETKKETKETKRFEINSIKQQTDLGQGTIQQSKSHTRTEELCKSAFDSISSLEESIKQLEISVDSITAPSSPSSTASSSPLSPSPTLVFKEDPQSRDKVKRERDRSPSKRPASQILKGPKPPQSKKAKPQPPQKTVKSPTRKQISSGGSPSPGQLSKPRHSPSSGSPEKAPKGQQSLQDPQQQFRQANRGTRTAAGDSNHSLLALPASKIPALCHSSGKHSASVSGPHCSNLHSVLQTLSFSSSSSSSTSSGKHSALSAPSHVPKSASRSPSSSAWGSKQAPALSPSSSPRSPSPPPHKSFIPSLNLSRLLPSSSHVSSPSHASVNPATPSPAHHGPRSSSSKQQHRLALSSTSQYNYSSSSSPSSCSSSSPTSSSLSPTSSSSSPSSPSSSLIPAMVSHGARSVRTPAFNPSSPGHGKKCAGSQAGRVPPTLAAASKDMA